MSRKIESRLGILYPSLGDTELTDIKTWLQRRGVTVNDYVFARSNSDGLHDVESLFETGSSATLANALIPMVGHVEVVAWACTSGSFIGGRVLAESQARGISEIIGGSATTTSLALVAALEMIGSDRFDAISPYPSAITERFVDFMKCSGFTVTSCTSLGSPSGDASRSLSLDIAVENHIARHGNRSIPLVVPDTAIDTLDLIDPLEERLSRPVITANQATLWQLIRLADYKESLSNAGWLFRCGGGL